MNLLEYSKPALTYKDFIKAYAPNPDFEKVQAQVRTDLYPDFDDVSKADFDAVMNYTTDSAKVNQSLWKLKNEDKTPSDKILDFIRTLNKTLNYLPNPDEKLIVYSGVRRPSDPTEWLKNGGIVNIPSYLSTSLNPRLAGQYVDFFTNEYMGKKEIPSKDKIGDLLIITIRPGQNVGGYVEDMAKNPSEQEFTIRCNFILKLTTTKPQILKLKFDSGETTLRIWNAIILNEKEFSENEEVNRYNNIKGVLS